MIDRTTKTMTKAMIKPLDGRTAPDRAGTGIDKEALKKACQQFEGLFMHQIMKGMRKTVMEGELLHGGNAEKIFLDLKDQAVSDELAQAGGLGMAEMLYRQLLGPEEANALGKTNKTVEAYQVPRQKDEPVLTEGSSPSAPEALVMPVEGRLSSGYGMRLHPVLNKERMHHGIDLAAPEGTKIKAAADGRVSFSGWVKGYGNLVEVDHGDGLISRYGHNKKNLVKVGDTVKAGQVLGKVGSTGMSTGPHLHFEVRKQGRPVDPYAMLGKDNRVVHKGSAKTTQKG